MFQNLNLKEELIKPSIEENEVLTICEVVEWMRPIAEYLDLEKFPDDKNQAKKIWIKVARYSL